MSKPTVKFYQLNPNHTISLSTTGTIQSVEERRVTITYITADGSVCVKTPTKNEWAYVVSTVFIPFQQQGNFETGLFIPTEDELHMTMIDTLYRATYNEAASCHSSSVLHVLEQIATQGRATSLTKEDSKNGGVLTTY